MEEAPIVKHNSSLLLKIFKALGITFLLFIIIGIIISLVFGNDIKQIIVKEINKQLSVEVKVNGEIEFSVLQNFPFASITFNTIEIRESYKNSHSNLLSSEKISLLFNILDIWNGNYTIKKIIVSNGIANVIINEKGEANYLIFKTVTDTADKQLIVQIDEILLSGLEVKFIDDKHQQLYEFQIHEGYVNGEFAADLLKLNLKASLLCKNMFVSFDNYLQNKELTISTELNLNLKDEDYSFKNTLVEIEKFAFTTTGNVKQKKNSTNIDLTFVGNKIGIESFRSLLPKQYSQYLEEYNSKGNLVLKGKIKGEYSNKKNPDISFAFAVKDATVGNSTIDAKFEHINFNAIYSNGVSRNLYSSQIQLKNATATINNKPVSFSLEIQNFKNPYINIQINTVLNLSEIHPLFKIPELKSASGDIQLNKCFYSGPINQLSSSSDFRTVKSGGEINISNGKMNYNGTSFESLEGSLLLENGNLIINNLSAKTLTSDFAINGNCTNFLPCLFNNSKNSNTIIKIGSTLTITSQNIDANEFKENHTSEQNNQAGSTAIASLLETVTGNIKFNIGHFKYDKFNATNFNGTLLCNGDHLFFNNISMNAEKGKAIINAQLNYSNWDHALLDGTFAGTNIDITQLFYEFNSWGQTVITDKNLKGTLTTNLVLKAGWNKNEIDYNQIVVVADVTIDKGELNNFEPMKSLSAFVKIDELKNIRFTKLNNQIEIRNSTINIPTMNIFTNSINLEASGIHTFENIIDYKIKLNLLQLLSNKFKSKNNFDIDAVEQNEDGLLFLFITMKGPASDPVIKYDKKSVKEKIKKDVEIEKINLKNILQKEFNNQKNEQQDIKNWKAPDEYQPMKFEDTTQVEEIIFKENDSSEQKNSSKTNQKQKEAFDLFKKSLQKKPVNPK